MTQSSFGRQTCRQRRLVHVRNVPVGSPWQCCMLQLGDGGKTHWSIRSLQSPCSVWWGSTQSHLPEHAYNALSVYSQCAVAQMCFNFLVRHEVLTKLAAAFFFETCLCRRHKPKVFRKCPPKAQPRRGALCLVSLECNNAICGCIARTIMFSCTKAKLTGDLVDCDSQVILPKQSRLWLLPVLLSKTAVKASPLPQGESTRLGTLIRNWTNNIYSSITCEGNFQDNLFKLSACHCSIGFITCRNGDEVGVVRGAGSCGSLQHELEVNLFVVCCHFTTGCYDITACSAD